MAIEAETPYVQPAVTAKEYASLWLTSIVIMAPTTTTGIVRISALPYDVDSNTIGPNSGVEVVVTDQLFDAVAEVPEVAAAYAAIVNAVAPLRAWIAARPAPVPVVPGPQPAPDP